MRKTSNPHARRAWPGVRSPRSPRGPLLTVDHERRLMRCPREQDAKGRAPTNRGRRDQGASVRLPFAADGQRGGDGVQQDRLLTGW